MTTERLMTTLGWGRHTPRPPDFIPNDPQGFLDLMDDAHRCRALWRPNSR